MDTYVQGSDPFVIGICSVELAGFKQLLHGRDIAHAGNLHDVLLLVLAIAGEASHLHLAVEFRYGGSGLC